MSGDARDFNNIETQFFIFLQCNTTNEIHTFLTETLGEYTQSYATVKNCVAQFKRGDFSTSDGPSPWRLTTVSTPEIIEHIHEVIFEDCRISAKSIAEQPGISRERVVSIINEDLDMRKISAKWIPKCLDTDQKLQPCRSFEQILELFFSGAIQMFSCCDW